jgi:HK97 family phage major capsid protein
MAEWHVEGEEVDAKSIVTNKITFTGHELMKVFSISAAARAMSLSGFESYLQQELARTMVTALEYAAVNGTGTGQPLGLLASNVIDNIVSSSSIFPACTEAVGKLKRGYSAGAVWAMNNSTLYNRVAGAQTATGEPLFNTMKETATSVILGRPVVVDDFLPDDVIIFGNFKYYAMNYPQGIMLEVSRDSSFRRGLIDYRAMAVADGKPIIGEAFVKIELT